MMRAADLGVSLPVLPVDRSYSPAYGESVEVASGIRRVLARNPNPFTFHGTGTYIVGRGQVAVIDPGPALDDHVKAILEATKGETITHILVTHTHNDHAPAAAPLKAATGAVVMGCGPHGSGRHGDGVEVEEGGDRSYVPDVQLGDGERVTVGGLTFEAVDTPGHTSNHVCFSVPGAQAFFPGDHVMGWSTTVIAPPDGDMADYLHSLGKLLALPEVPYYPTHGNPITRPHDFVRALIAHRHAREAQIEACIARGLSMIAEMVPVIYSEVDARLHPAASRSVLAHLQHMVATGRVACEGDTGAGSRYHLLRS
jgi:glyoxylase-like metal-dependent hydrolase (beta-lactamase superfamily II)